MKAQFFYLSILFFILLTSCEKDNLLTEDELLKHELVGSWKGMNNSTTYTFFENNSYVDSLFIGQENETLGYVINGKYKIENGYLLFDEVVLTYHIDKQDLSITASLVLMYPQLKLQIIQDELTFIQTMIFTSNQSNHVNELNGKWSSDMIISAYDSEQNPDFVDGTLLKEIDFLSDPNYCNIKNTYYYGTKEYIDSWDSVKYDYSLSYLVFAEFGESYFLSFESNKMIWEGEIRTYDRVE
jgi:hypothetical protein